MKSDIHVVCVKWGDKYPAEYVNRLYAMVQKNLDIPHQFHCLTEQSSGIDSKVHILSLPITSYEGWWIKLMLFQQDFFGLQGRIIYLDLDLVITGNIDFLAEDNVGLSIIENWSRNRMWNSSVMSFRIGSLQFVWDRFALESFEEVKMRYNGDQEWIFHCIPEAHIYPKQKIISYKKSCNARFGKCFVWTGLRLEPPKWLKAKLPVGARIVVFHGKPDPDDVVDKHWNKWKHAPFVKKYWITS